MHILIEALADVGESLAKAEGPLTQVQHKYSNMEVLKVKDSKKRRRVVEPAVPLDKADSSSSSSPADYESSQVDRPMSEAGEQFGALRKRFTKM